MVVCLSCDQLIAAKREAFTAGATPSPRGDGSAAPQFIGQHFVMVRARPQREKMLTICLAVNKPVTFAVSIPMVAPPATQVHLIPNSLYWHID
jgi:hypothetical protein